MNADCSTASQKSQLYAEGFSRDERTVYPIDEANAPLRCNFSVFATTPCRGFSQSVTCSYDM